MSGDSSKSLLFLEKRGSNMEKYQRKDAVEKVCNLCGKHFFSANKVKRYCSEECKQKANGITSCTYCGKLFQKKKPNHHFCSTDCKNAFWVKSIAVHEERKCPVCGKLFISNNDKQEYCSRTCYTHNYRGNLRTQAEVNQQALEKIKSRLEEFGFEYISGYFNQKSRIIIKCKECETLRTYCADAVRNIRANPKCERCAEKEREFKKAKAKAERERKQFIKQCKPFEFEEIKICADCGAPFSGKREICNDCFKEQSRKRKNKYHSNRKEKRVSKEKRNRSLTWHTLWDNGERICALCGEPCDPDDYTTDENGNILVGIKYPSLDHIVPVFAGGGDFLDNVQLAHFRCNTIRGVKDWKNYREIQNERL